MAKQAEEQLALALPPTWGGRRKRAGRKPVPGRRPPTPPCARPQHRAGHPLHVTMRARSGLPSLRAARIFPRVRAAIAAGSRATFRIVHFSVQRDHVHLLCEGDDKRVVARGLIGLAVRLARAVTRALDRRGQIWGDRLHHRALASPREVRHGLVYVLMNFRKHMASPPAGLDPCSSAAWFDGFHSGRGADHGAHGGPTSGGGPPPLVRPRTWLAATGWRRHGLISQRERPA